MVQHLLRRLPAALEQLIPLAYNLRWSWEPRTAALLEEIDPELWLDSGRNPVRLLSEASEDRLQQLANDEGFRSRVAAAAADLERYLGAQDTWFARVNGRTGGFHVAYFSAEFAIAECLRIYAGGLGVLAGDHLKSASDLGVPLAAVGLLYREGYFSQEIGRDDRQHHEYPQMVPEALPLTLERTPDGAPLHVAFPLVDREVNALVWRADVGRVRLFLLDTDLEGNHPDDRRIADRLYGGDLEHRLRQEAVLGIGGMRALEALGIQPSVVHLNEGHAAFAAVERIRQYQRSEQGSFLGTADRLAGGTVFTTHTPVAAGHDEFPAEVLERYLGAYIVQLGEPWQNFLALGRANPADASQRFSMSVLALRLSGRRNGVSRLHGKVTRAMWHSLWPDVAEEAVPIGHITNGVHLPTWAAPATDRLYTEHLGSGWRDAVDEVLWQRAAHIPDEELWAVRNEQRRALVSEARRRLAKQVEGLGEDASWTAGALQPDALTIVFARRFAAYKRATLLLSNPERLLGLLNGPRPVQFIFAGKAHPRDELGQDLLHEVVAFSRRHDVRDRFLFLGGYDLALARALVSGADVWLNVPFRPYEASGTSGMKAVLNGALNVSILDGWWAEAWAEHNRAREPIGWAIDAPVERPEDQHRADADALFTALEESVVPAFYDRAGAGIPEGWTARMRASIRQLAPFFNTHRMVGEYTRELYLPSHAAGVAQGTLHAASVS